MPTFAAKILNDGFSNWAFGSSSAASFLWIIVAHPGHVYLRRLVDAVGHRSTHVSDWQRRALLRDALLVAQESFSASSTDLVQLCTVADQVMLDPSPLPDRTRCHLSTFYAAGRPTFWLPRQRRGNVLWFALVACPKTRRKWSSKIIAFARTSSISIIGRTRSSKRPCFTVLGSRKPKIFSRPRTSVARLIVFFNNALRVLSEARTLCASRLFVCTELNEPVRRTWAISRASFLSVLLRISERAAVTWRACLHRSNSSLRPS